MTRVAIVGAGAAGTMAALHLLRRNDSRELHLTVIDPDAKTGPGVPYRTTDPRHLLNVPAGKLGVDSAEPLGFVAWLHDNGQTDTGPGDFVPRGCSDATSLTCSNRHAAIGCAVSIVERWR